MKKFLKSFLLIALFFIFSGEVLAQTVNRPPVANAGPDKNITTYTLPVKTIVQLDGYRSYDPEGRRLSCTWSQVSGPNIVSINAPGNGCAAQISSLFSGTYEFKLKVSDGSLSAEDVVAVNVSYIKPLLQVIYPNGREVFKAGQTMKVDFNSNIVDKSHVLQLIPELGTGNISLTSGASKRVTVSGLNSFGFTLPASSTPGRYSVKVSAYEDFVYDSPIISDMSDRSIKIEAATHGVYPSLIHTYAASSVGLNNNDDIGHFYITFQLTAIGKDIYIPASIGAVSYIVDKAGVPVSQNISAVFTSRNNLPKTANGNYLIKNGESKNFDLTVSVPMGGTNTAGQYRLSINGLRWRDADVTSSPYTLTTGLEDFKTSYKVLNYGDRASQIASIQATLNSLLEALKSLPN